MATTKKITELNQTNSASNSDMLYIVTDPSNIPQSKRIAVGDLLRNVNVASNSTIILNAASNTANALASNAYAQAVAYANVRAQEAYESAISFANTKSNEVYNSAIVYVDTAIAGIGSSQVAVQERYYDYGASSLYGTSGLTAVTGLAADDAEYEIALPFSVTFMGVSYDSVWLNTNSYLSFLSIAAASGYAIYYPIDPMNMRVPGIIVGAADRQLTSYYYGSTDDGRFVIRYEGISSNGGGDGNFLARVWEIWFYENDPGRVTLVVDDYPPEGWPTGVWGIHDGFKWIDVFDPLPRIDQTSQGQTQTSVDIQTQSADIVSDFRFVGSGVQSYINGNTAYIEINPMQGFINLGLDSEGDTTLSSAYYGLNLKSAHSQPIRISSAADVQINAASGTPAFPIDGRNINLFGGNGLGNTSSPDKNGGSVFLFAGLRDGAGSNGVVVINTDDAYDWTFTGGSLNHPTASIDHAGTGYVMKLGSNNQQAIITGPEANPDFPSAPRLVVQGQPGYDNGEGGDVYLWAGHSGVNGGTGGDIKVDAGTGYNSSAGGGVKIRGGASVGGEGGYVEIWSGQGNTGANITLSTWANTTNTWNQWVYHPEGYLSTPGSSYISFGSVSVGGAPDGTRNGGEKLVLLDAEGNGYYSSSIGVEFDSMWFGVDNDGSPTMADGGFKWYAANAQIMKLTRAGDLTIAGKIVSSNGGFDANNLNWSDSIVANTDSAVIAGRAGDFMPGEYFDGGSITLVAGNAYPDGLGNGRYGGSLNFYAGAGDIDTPESNGVVTIGTSSFNWSFEKNAIIPSQEVYNPWRGTYTSYVLRIGRDTNYNIQGATILTPGDAPVNDPDGSTLAIFGAAGNPIGGKGGDVYLIGGFGSNSTSASNAGSVYIQGGRIGDYNNPYSFSQPLGNVYLSGQLINMLTSNSTGGNLFAFNIASNGATLSNDKPITFTGSATGTINATAYSGTANAANLASYIVANNGLVSNSLGVFVKANTGIVSNTTGLFVNSTYIATLTSNNTSYVGTVTAANVVSNTQLQSNLANYAALSGAAFTNSVTIANSVTITKQATLGATQESFVRYANANGLFTFDCSNSTVFYLTTPAASFTPSLSNLTLGNNFVTSVTFFINQGITPYVTTSNVQIGGVNNAISWQAGLPPSGSASKKDIITLSIMNVSGTYTVIGQLTTFG